MKMKMLKRAKAALVRLLSNRVALDWLEGVGDGVAELSTGSASAADVSDV